MLELYLFINPIGTSCFNSEQNILRLAEALKDRLKFCFIPFINLETISSMMVENSLPLNNLNLRNRLFQKAYQASLDYKAALFQGKKHGREFLLSLQQEIFENNVSYCDKLVQQIAANSHLDWEMFTNDRRSNFTANSFRQDLQMAAEMKVRNYPTIVIYNLKGIDCGVSLTECNSYQLLEDLCNGRFNDLLINQSNSKNQNIPHLHTL
ncbi:DsbA family protein [Liquorilactobacillus sicerae]|uniref:DsbA family protein n=1 Tax=Liquorilactobacillus sicerae TaxID=1416943 RepID=UPI00248085AA